MTEILNQSVNSVAGRSIEVDVARAPVDAVDQQRFEAALNRPEPGTVEPPAIGEGATDNVNPVPCSESATPAKSTMGDAILNAVGKVRDTLDSRSNRIQERIYQVDGNTLSMEEMMQVNFEVMQMSIEQELTGKIATKSSEGVQTLFKNNQ